jgi:putative ABC transport system substrate-binding protein
MDRRCAVSITALLSLGATPLLWAQQAKMARVAWLTMERADPEAPFWLGFRMGMRELGWTEGQNIVIDPWGADGSLERLKQLIPEIVASRPDVIVAATGTAVPALIQANVQQPVVFAQSSDPVIGKVVQSWARPGVNRTGISYFSLELVPKRLELMKQLLPRMKRVAIVGWPPHAGEPLELDAAKVAAESLGLASQYWGVVTAPEVDAALIEIEKWRAEAILVFGGAVAAGHAGRLAAYGMRHRIPTVSAWR